MTAETVLSESCRSAVMGVRDADETDQSRENESASTNTQSESNSSAIVCATVFRNGSRKGNQLQGEEVRA